MTSLSDDEETKVLCRILLEGRSVSAEDHRACFEAVKEFGRAGADKEAFKTTIKRISEITKLSEAKVVELISTSCIPCSTSEEATK